MFISNEIICLKTVLSYFQCKFDEISFLRALIFFFFVENIPQYLNLELLFLTNFLKYLRIHCREYTAGTGLPVLLLFFFFF